jgi:hypothetical protein
MRIGRSLLLVLTVAGLSGQSASHSGIHPEDMDPTCKAILRDANRERI